MRTFAALLSLGLSSLLFAQQPPPTSDQKQEMREQAMENMQELGSKLQLSEDQKTKLKPIFQDQAKKIGDLRNDTSLDQRGKMRKMRQIRDDFDKQAKPILSDAQWKTLQDYRKENREKMMQQMRSKQ